MKFMVTWKVRPDKLQEAVERFLNTGDPLPEGVKSIARYHRADMQGGVHILESNDAGVMAGYAARWGDLLDLETALVVEDAEAIPAYSQINGVRLQSKGAGGR